MNRATIPLTGGKRPQRRRVERALLGLGLGLGLAACYDGRDADPDAAPGGPEASGADSAGSSGDGDSDGNGSAAEPIATTPPTVRRLTRAEIGRSLLDLTGADLDTEAVLPAEEEVGAFRNNADALTFPAVFAEGLVTLARRAAEHAAERLVASGDCDAPLSDACARAELERLATRAWRRSIDADEWSRLEDVYATGAEHEGPEHGLVLAIQAVLVSAPFVYRFEFGERDEHGVLRPTSAEMAVRLSFLIWGRGPDESLMERGRSGALRDADAILAEAERMLDDPRAHEAIAEFHRQWLNLDELGSINKDPELFDHWSPDLVGRFGAETQRFLDEVAFSGQISELFDGRFTYVDATLAEFYGIDGPSGDELERVTLPPEAPRAGLLTQGSILAMNAGFGSSSPVRRGAFVRERLLCDVLAPPPPDVDDTIPEPSTAETTRERYEEHMVQPTCAACHVQMDPIGFGFEHYDATGKYREQENDRPIDASGYVEGTDIERFEGAIELADALAAQPRVTECMARQWATYAYGRSEDQRGAASIDPVVEAALRTGRYRDVILATVATPEFLALGTEQP